MDPLTLSALAATCAPLVHPSTVAAIVATESSFNPNAIGVVRGALSRQPRTSSEALRTINALTADRWNFSVGLGQINVHNFERLGLTPATAIDPCRNLGAMQTILLECFQRAPGQAESQVALRQALSCYYSGNFVAGFPTGYVSRVARSVLLHPATRPP